MTGKMGNHNGRQNSVRKTANDLTNYIPGETPYPGDPWHLSCLSLYALDLPTILNYFLYGKQYMPPYPTL